MDYNKIFFNEYNSTHDKTETYIKNKMQESIEDEIIDFTIVSNDLLKEHYTNKKEHELNKRDDLNKVYQAFQGGKIKYGNNIKKIIDKVIQPLINEIPITNYSLEDLTKLIAEYNSTDSCFRIFKNQNDLFEIIYKSKDFSKFEIKEYDTVLQYTEIYQYYTNLVYPTNEQEKRIPFKQNTNNDLDIDDEITYKLREFELDEKYLILHAFYKVIEQKKFDSKNIELAEFLRLIVICQGIDDKTLFDKNYTKKFYKSVSDGITYSSNSQHKRKLKQRTLNKLKDLQVPEIEEYIKELKI